MRSIRNYFNFSFVLLLVFSFSCKKKEDLSVLPIPQTDWNRQGEPVYRDLIPEESYESASDGHVFFDDGVLKMIYSGDIDGLSGIKMATGTSWKNWTTTTILLGETGPSGTDISKETSFYRKTADGKHQIYYIGYPDGSSDSYEAEIYLAEADDLEGPYVQMDAPIVPKGLIAGKNVYCMTSPSIMEHDNLLYLAFLGWNASPDAVSEVWVLGATSVDEGHTWDNFKEVDCAIGMEGQVTKGIDGKFYAVSTGMFENKEAVFYAEADHPFGPWDKNKIPILTQAGAPYEKDEIIAPQITLDPVTQKKYVYYTGADYTKGWWMMLATEP